MLSFSGERIVPGAENCEPLFALKMYQEHIARYLFASQVAQDKAVLDVGCGVGYGSQMLARKGASSVTAFDLSEEAIAHAQEFCPHPNVRYLVASAESFSFAQTFDLVTCFELIEHLPKQHDAIKHIATVLKPDGLLVISTPRPNGTPRSAFHARELSFLDFSTLLSCYFPHIEWYFENNHFASLIAGSAPEAIQAIHALHPQFGIGQADYFVAVASHSPINRELFRNQLVLNDDAYVKNLERDVAILHKAETDAKQQISALTSQAETLQSETQLLRSEADKTEQAIRQLEEAKAEIVKLNQAKAQDLQMADHPGGDRDGIDLKLEIVRLSHELASTRLQKAEQIRRGQAKDQLIEGLKAELSRLKDLSTKAKEESNQWRNSALEAQMRASSLQQQINAICASRSWKVTEPLRRVAFGLRGRGLSGNRTLPLPAQEPLSVPVNVSNSAVPTSPEGTAADAAPSVDVGGRDLSLDRREFDVLYVIGCHDGESKRYRVHNLVNELTRCGYVAESLSDSEIPDIVNRRYLSRVIVLFRCAYSELLKQLLAYCRENGIVTIFDIDDLVFEPENIGYVHVVQSLSEEDRACYLRDVRRYRQTLMESDRVTCTTDYLAQRVSALGKPVDVIPNSLNDSQLAISRSIKLDLEPDTDEVRIGYFSGSNTHQVDFRACEAALLHVLRNYPQARFVLVGILDLRPEWEQFADRIERHPIVSYERMLKILATTHINLAPLEIGNPYCESKSQLKIFEAGVASVPTVASSTQSYREAISDGVDGFLASTTDEWINALEKLLKSSMLRAEVGNQAKRRALKQFGPKVVARQAAQVYGLPMQSYSEEEMLEGRLKITWIVPGIIVGGGGHRNILRAAYYLEQFGHDVELYFTSTQMDSYELKETVRTHFYPLQCPMHRYEGLISSTDVLFATHWSTVDVALRARNAARELIYFVQDFEPAFAPMGTEYILAENTYRLGMYHITSGPWCEELLKRQFGCEADHFLFPIDRSIYYPRPHKKTGLNIIFFAKPEMPRRCFELGLMALEQFHKLRPDVEIIMFGSSHLRNLTPPFPATTLSVVPTLEDLAQLYSNGTVGIAFSTTNPSLVPYEMMACGLPVVDLGRPGNEINYGSRSDIAFLADPEPATMATQIRDLIEDRQQLAERSQKGLEFIRCFPSEEQMARRVEELILNRMATRGVDSLVAHA